MVTSKELHWAGGESKPSDSCTPVHVWARCPRAYESSWGAELGPRMPDCSDVVNALLRPIFRLEVRS